MIKVTYFTSGGLSEKIINENEIEQIEDYFRQMPPGQTTQRGSKIVFKSGRFLISSLTALGIVDKISEEKKTRIKEKFFIIQELKEGA